MRNPPQINYPPGTVQVVVSHHVVRYGEHLGWYLTVASSVPEGAESKAPTYAEQSAQRINTKL